MRRVHIIYIPDADLRGPDLERINTVEEFPDDVARVMVSNGVGVYAEDEDEPEPDGPTAGGEPERPSTVMKPAKQGRRAPVQPAEEPRVDTGGQ